jgi:hypothetical protein
MDEQRYLISWYQLYDDVHPVSPLAENIKVWWSAGKTADAHILYAVVDAESDREAVAFIRSAWSPEGFKSRSIELKPNGWMPTDGQIPKKRVNEN